MLEIRIHAVGCVTWARVCNFVARRLAAYDKLWSFEILWEYFTGNVMGSDYDTICAFLLKEYYTGV